MDVLEKIALLEYNPIPYPTKPKKPILSSTGRATAADAQAYADNMKTYEAANEEFKAELVAYNKDVEAKRVQFRKDLDVEFEMVGHPKADLLFEKAWDRAHGEGLAQVYYAYADLSELVL